MNRGIANASDGLVERMARALCRQYELDEGFSQEQADRVAESEMYRNFIPSAQIAIAVMEPLRAQLESAKTNWRNEIGIANDQIDRLSVQLKNARNALEPFAKAIITPDGTIIGLMREDVARARAVLQPDGGTNGISS